MDTKKVYTDPTHFGNELSSALVSHKTTQRSTIRDMEQFFLASCEADVSDECILQPSLASNFTDACLETVHSTTTERCI